MKYIYGIIVFAALFIAGCSSSSDDAPAGATIVELHIEPKISILHLGTSEYYKAIAIYSDNSVSDVSDEVTWSLENDSGIVEPSTNPDYPGLSFATAVMVGQDNIVATLNGVSTTSAVEVVDVELVSLAVSPQDQSISVGDEQAFIVEGTYTDGHTQDLTDEADWSTDNSTIASITENGIATGESTGSATITATIGTVSNTANLSVYQKPEIVQITTSPASAELFVGNSRQFSAFAEYSDGNIRNITNEVLWISSDTSVAAQDIYRKGEFRALSAGRAIITADYGINYTANSVVEIEEVVIEDIVISPQDATVIVGETRNYFTEARTSDGKLYSVNQSPDQFYSIDDPSIAYISNNPDNKGRLRGLEAGTTTVRSQFTYEGETFTTETTVTVTP